jgi:hypothetical protein
VTSFELYKNIAIKRANVSLTLWARLEKLFILTVYCSYFLFVINRILYSCRFNTKFIELVEDEPEARII